MEGARRPLARAAIAVACVAVAFAVQMLGPGFFRAVPFMAFFVAVFIASWFGGLTAAVVATPISAFVVNWFFLPPFHALATSGAPLVATLVFSVAGVLFGILSEARLRSLERVSAALRVREEFLTIAAHELRTPLTTLQLQVQLLQRGEPGSLEVVDRQVRRMSRLVEQVVSAPEMDTMPLDARDLDVSELVRNIVHELADGTVHVAAPEPVRGTFDPLRLTRLTVSLVDNALKYGGGKPVEVGVRREQRAVVIEVRDFGIGIAAGDQARIFEAFERAVPARNFGGLGLGLFVARSAARAHGGNIQVRSAPGEGAVFRVELPIR